MTNAIRDILASFDQLPRAEQIVVAKEIQSRFVNVLDFSPMSDGELAFLADELFQMYDKEESENASA